MIWHPILRVARPADALGGLARTSAWVTWAAITLLIVLVRWPADWARMVGTRPWVVRLVLVLLAIRLVRGLAALVYARLPGAAFVWAGVLHVRRRGGYVRERLRDIRDVHVEIRVAPDHELLVITLRDGREIDVCPTGWPGAGRVYTRLARAAGSHRPT